MKKALFFLLFNASIYAQVGIGTTTPQGALDINSTDSGILIPRIALLSKNTALPVINPQGGTLEIGTMVWNTTTSGVFPNDLEPGYYYWDGINWVAVANGKFWSTYGNSGIDENVNFIGTSDAKDIIVKTDDTERARITKVGNFGLAEVAPDDTFDVIGTSQIKYPLSFSGINYSVENVVKTISSPYSFNSSYFPDSESAGNYMDISLGGESYRSFNGLTKTGLGDGTLLPLFSPLLALNYTDGSYETTEKLYCFEGIHLASEKHQASDPDYKTASLISNLRLFNDNFYIENKNLALDKMVQIYSEPLNGVIFSFGNYDGTVKSYYRFPMSDGANGQAMFTDGAGILSWQSLPSSLIGSTSGIVSNPSGFGTNEVWLGELAGSGASKDNTIFLGYNAGNNAANATNAIFIGNSSGFSDTVNNLGGTTSILIGNNTSTGGFSNSIAIGAGATNTEINQLMIGSASSPIDLVEIKGSSAILIPNGDSTQRPSTLVFGQLRYNSTIGRGEMYVNDVNGDGVQGDSGWRAF